MSNAASPEIRIRAAVPADVPLILAFVRELAEYERAPNAVVATEESLRAHLFDNRVASEGTVAGDAVTVGRRPPGADLPNPRAHCRVDALIGEIDGRPEGFALYFSNFSTWLATSGIYLEDLFVRPHARGRGLGKALLTELARIAVARGCGRLEWAVLNWNEPAIGFYKSLGAKPQDEWTVFRLTGEGLRRLGS